MTLEREVTAKSSLGEAIEARRAELGISMNEATAQLGIARGTYTAWRRGQHPDPDQWARLGEWLGRSRVELALMLGMLDEDEIRQFRGRTVAKRTSPRSRADQREHSAA